MSFNYRDKVRVLTDASRDGKHAGRTGRIASNELGGIIWVHLGLHYASFYAADLELITEEA